ncbi:MAG: DUF805 domain-containing protein [Proteobacteria bacterium]|nr:DUF805 domain-containing protein [Pseudomonadota bacterium]
MEPKKVGFVDAIKLYFANYANFSGRSRRSEYWWVALFNFIVQIVTYYPGYGMMQSAQLQGKEVPGIAMALLGIYCLFGLATFIPALSLMWRRLHDIGKSGAYFFCILIPIVGPILLLIWALKDSDPGENQYGPNPKA